MVGRCLDVLAAGLCWWVQKASQHSITNGFLFSGPHVDDDLTGCMDPAVSPALTTAKATYSNGEGAAGVSR